MRFLSGNLSILSLCVAAVLLVPVLAGCQSDEGQSTPAGETAGKAVSGEPTETAEPMEEAPVGTATLKFFPPDKAGEQSKEVPYLPPGKKIATIETAKGDIVIELWEDKAPNTVVNFVYMANAGRYDGVPFHRVIDGFMAQTGDVEKKGGYGGPGYTIPAEFNAGLKHERGVVSMARSSDPNSAGSQFFIMFKAAPHLDGQYAAFGKVIEGMDVVDSIKKGDAASNGSVTNPDTMIKVRVVSVPDEPAQPEESKE
jgi:peptidyl-prolyl cis-trans isomerase B (cyclophilin B)